MYEHRGTVRDELGDSLFDVQQAASPLDWDTDGAAGDEWCRDEAATTVNGAGTPVAYRGVTRSPQDSVVSAISETVTTHSEQVVALRLEAEIMEMAVNQIEQALRYIPAGSPTYRKGLRELEEAAALKARALDAVARVTAVGGHTMVAALQRDVADMQRALQTRIAALEQRICAGENLSPLSSPLLARASSWQHLSPTAPAAPSPAHGTPTAAAAAAAPVRFATAPSESLPAYGPASVSAAPVAVPRIAALAPVSTPASARRPPLPPVTPGAWSAAGPPPSATPQHTPSFERACRSVQALALDADGAPASAPRPPRSAGRRPAPSRFGYLYGDATDRRVLRLDVGRALRAVQPHSPAASIGRAHARVGPVSIPVFRT